LRRFLTAVLAVCALAFTASATAGNWQDGKLDQIASSVAQRPVSVWCESSESDWIHTGDHFGQNWDSLFGFTSLTTPVVYVNPRECATLHALVGGEDVGSYWGSIAMLTLIHEATHQRLSSGDEALVECSALKLLPTVAQAGFSVPTTVAQKYVASRTVASRARQDGSPHRPVHGDPAGAEPIPRAAARRRGPLGRRAGKHLPRRDLLAPSDVPPAGARLRLNRRPGPRPGDAFQSSNGAGGSPGSLRTACASSTLASHS
jgi:hypothetical protein